MKIENKISRKKFISSTATAMAAIPILPFINNMEPSKNALKYAEEHREELIDLLEKLIQVQSIQGESAADAQKVVKDYLSKLSYRIEESEDQPSSYKNHPEYMNPSPAGDGPFTNVVGWPKKQNKQQYAMFSHIDTHSIEDGWTTNPFEPKIIDGKLYGLGT